MSYREVKSRSTLFIILTVENSNPTDRLRTLLSYASLIEGLQEGLRDFFECLVVISSLQDSKMPTTVVTVRESFEERSHFFIVAISQAMPSIRDSPIESRRDCYYRVAKPTQICR